MLKLNKILFFFILTYNIAFAQDKNSVFENLTKQFKNLNTIFIEYESFDVPNLKGSILAKKGNYYKIISGNRIITCDSKTIWNYSVTDKNVIISNFKNLSSASLENVFFQLIDEYEPISLNKTSSSKGFSYYELKLNSKSNESTNFSSIILNLNSNFSIESIKLIDNFREINLKIKQIKLNQKIDDKTFKFELNDNIEVIDLR